MVLAKVLKYLKQVRNPNPIRPKKDDFVNIRHIHLDSSQRNEDQVRYFRSGCLLET